MVYTEVFQRFRGYGIHADTQLECQTTQYAAQTTKKIHFYFVIQLVRCNFEVFKYQMNVWFLFMTYIVAMELEGAKLPLYRVAV